MRKGIVTLVNNDAVRICFSRDGSTKKTDKPYFGLSVSNALKITVNLEEKCGASKQIRTADLTLTKD